MALTDPNSTGLAFDPARLPKRFRDSSNPYPALYSSLARLGELRDEAWEELQLSQLLHRSPQASLALMLLGGLVLLAASLQGGASLSEGFVWSLWVLTGIAAMTVIYIRGFASHPPRQTLKAAAGELRKFLLYAGFAWGLGVFLIMPEQPSLGLILGFAVLPGWVLTVILKDEKGALAFSAPAALLAASACILRPWSHGLLAAAVITLAWALGTFMLHRANPRARFGVALS